MANSNDKHEQGAIKEDTQSRIEHVVQRGQFGQNDFAEMKAKLDRLLWRLIDVLASDDLENPNPLLSKQIEAIGVALKHLEKLDLMRRALEALERPSLEAAQRDPIQTALVLKKIEKRVHDLADQRARDLIGRTVGMGDPTCGSRMDSERTEQASIIEQA